MLSRSRAGSPEHAAPDLTTAGARRRDTATMEGELVVEDIEDLELDIEEEEYMEMTSIDSWDDSIGVLALNLIGEELKPSPGAGQPPVMSVVPKAPGEHLPWVQNDSMERLVKLMGDLLKASPVDVVCTSGGQIRIVHTEQNVGSDSPASRSVPESKGSEPATRSPSVTSIKEARQATKDEPRASLGKTLEPQIGDQRGYKVIRVGGKTRSGGEDDTEGDYERDKQGVTQQQSRASPGADASFSKEKLPQNCFNGPREDGDLLLQEEEEGCGSPWVRVEEVPDLSVRASHTTKRAESQSLSPGGITITRMTGSLSSEAFQETRAKPGPSWWLCPSPAYPLCNEDRIHCLEAFRIVPRGFAPGDWKELEEELREKLSSCNEWGADTRGIFFSKAKKQFSNYRLCSSGNFRAPTLAQEAVLREIVVASLQKKTLVGTMPSAHQRCTPTLQAMTSQPRCGDFSPSFLQRALRKLKMLLKKQSPNPG